MRLPPLANCAMAPRSCRIVIQLTTIGHAFSSPDRLRQIPWLVWVKDPICRQLHSVIDEKPRYGIAPNKDRPVPANRGHKESIYGN